MRRRLPTSISRPRREWWSLLCSRRWPVSSLIRSVSRATWTSAEPVSPSARPYLPISSLFFSLVRPMSCSPQKNRAPRGSRPLEASTDALGVLDVAAHLRDQPLGVGEALLPPQPLDEGDPQSAAVEVFVAVDQIGLDQDPATALESRPDADVDRGRDTVGKGRVDAVTGNRQAVVGDEVGGREAELATALVALDDLALDHEGGAEAVARALHVAGGNQGSDPGRGDRLAVDLDQRHDPSLELRPRSQHRRVPLRLRPEAEVLADRDLGGAEPLDQDVLDEVLGVALGELAVEGDYDQLLDPEPLDHVALDGERHDQLRQRRRVQDLERVRVEGEDGVGIVDHRLMAKVDAVEGADRDVAGARLGVGERGDLDAHRSASATAGTSSATRSISSTSPESSTRKGPIAVRRR